MKRIAIPLIGGVITSAIHTLVLIPVYYFLYKRWQQWRETWGQPDGQTTDEPITDVAPAKDGGDLA